MRILMVEDDEQIREVVRDYFENHAKEYELTCAEDGPKGLAMLRKEPYDLLLLDVMLPGMSGFSILRELRRTNAQKTGRAGMANAQSTGGAGMTNGQSGGTPFDNGGIPVIIITAKIREEDRLLGYELGCDDYVCKPFSIAELCAKVGAVLRRVQAGQGTYIASGQGTIDRGACYAIKQGACEAYDRGPFGTNAPLREKIISCNSIVVNLNTHDVMADGRKITLSPKEYELLLTFMEHPNWIFTREMLLDRIWGMDYEGTERTVDNHVKKLRKSLGVVGKQIKTVFRKGYKLEQEEN